MVVARREKRVTRTKRISEKDVLKKEEIPEKKEISVKGERILKREHRDIQRTEDRPKRVPVSGNRDILTVQNKEKGFHYRWVMDRGMRVSKFIQGGYEIAPDHGLIVGDARVGVSSQYGSTVVSTSQDGSNLVLMRIKQEWYDEDQEAKAQAIIESEEAMAELGEGQYGTTGIINQRTR